MLRPERDSMRERNKKRKGEERNIDRNVSSDSNSFIRLPGSSSGELERKSKIEIESRGVTRI